MSDPLHRMPNLQEMEKKLKGTMSIKAYVSPIKDYIQPKLVNIATKIDADDPEFAPNLSPTPEILLKACIPSQPDGTIVTHALSFRSQAIVDCGFSMEIPAGYRAVIRGLPNLQSRGGYVIDARTETVGMHRVKVFAHNLGREIMVIKHGDPIASMTLEPVFFFDWVSPA